jgi:hypothetical protein
MNPEVSTVAAIADPTSCQIPPTDMYNPSPDPNPGLLL